MQVFDACVDVHVVFSGPGLLIVWWREGGGGSGVRLFFLSAITYRSRHLG